MYRCFYEYRTLVLMFSFEWRFDFFTHDVRSAVNRGFEMRSPTMRYTR